MPVTAAEIEAALREQLQPDELTVTDDSEVRAGIPLLMDLPLIGKLEKKVANLPDGPPSPQESPA